MFNTIINLLYVDLPVQIKNTKERQTLLILRTRGKSSLKPEVEVSSKICVFVHNEAITTKYPPHSAVRSLVCGDNYIYFKGKPTPCVSLIIFLTLRSTLAHPGRVSVDATR